MTQWSFWIFPSINQSISYFNDMILSSYIAKFIAVYDHQSDDKFSFWRLFWIFPSHTLSSCRGDGGFVDYDSGAVAGHLQKIQLSLFFF